MTDTTGNDQNHSDNGKVDAIAALAMVTIFVVTVLFWLSNQ